ncbi:MAG: cobalamin-binding protein [Gammaproteobacteria bacterium]|nr:cobalamin-binding protein [Gammaproteobacteria bacterium]MBQ0841145.1 cobalamin-binding protein [Gammaproteobacteria bacterium]
MKVRAKLKRILWASYWLATLLGLSCPPIQAAVSVIDGSGASVQLAQPARRIISLAPHLTELLFTAGAGGQIVATVDYSDYPSEALKIPRIGSNNAISYEAIVGLAPDLVLVWQSGNGPQMIARLKALGLNVYVDAPAGLDDIATTIEGLGQLAGTAEQGAQAAAQYRQTLADLRRRYSGRQPLSVFYQVWDDPLLTLNGQHLVSEVIQLCGGRNVFADAPALVPKLSAESVIAANPQLMVASGTQGERARVLKQWRAWPMIDAVKTDRLYFLPPDLLVRHSPRLLQGAEILCQQLEAARRQ